MHNSAYIYEHAVDDIDRLLSFTAHDVLFIMRVIEQYPGVYEDEIQGRLSSVRKRPLVWPPHESMLNLCTSKYTTRQRKLEE